MDKETIINKLKKIEERFNILNKETRTIRKEENNLLNEREKLRTLLITINKEMIIK